MKKIIVSKEQREYLNTIVNLQTRIAIHLGDTLQEPIEEVFPELKTLWEGCFEEQEKLSHWTINLSDGDVNIIKPTEKSEPVEDTYGVSSLECFKQVADVIGKEKAVEELTKVYECEKCWKDPCFELAGILEDAFNWEDSPQEYEFWEKVFNGFNPFDEEVEND